MDRNAVAPCLGAADGLGPEDQVFDWAQCADIGKKATHLFPIKAILAAPVACQELVLAAGPGEAGLAGGSACLAVKDAVAGCPSPTAGNGRHGWRSGPFMVRRARDIPRMGQAATSEAGGLNGRRAATVRS